MIIPIAAPLYIRKQLRKYLQRDIIKYISKESYFQAEYLQISIKNMVHTQNEESLIKWKYRIKAELHPKRMSETTRDVSEKEEHMTKFISWNIDSLNAALTSDSPRALLSRDVLNTLAREDADIIAIQETKLPATGPAKKHTEALETLFPGYHVEWISSEPPARKGYAGTMILYKEGIQAKKIAPRIGAPSTMDDEGRLLVLDCGGYFFANVYTPNAGDGLGRLSERQEWDKCYAEYLSQLDQKKPVIACGDFNVAHKEIDLAHPESNHMSAGFTDEEREGFTNLLAKGFVDTFRYVHGDVKDVYSWWAQRIRTSKINNSGWRIDYFLVSDRIKERVKRSEMIDSGPRQDHTPILLEMEF